MWSSYLLIIGIIKNSKDSQNWQCQRNVLNASISKLDKHVVLLLINYIASQLSGIAES